MLAALLAFVRVQLRDHDSSHGAVFQDQVEALGMAELRSGKGKPWQNPYVERLIRNDPAGTSSCSLITWFSSIR